MAYISDFKEPEDVIDPDEFEPEEGVDFGYEKKDSEGNVVETEGSPEHDPSSGVKGVDDE